MNNQIKKKDDDLQYLLLTMKFEDGKDVKVQCKSSDKIEVPINHFLNKTLIKKEEYDFIIIKKKKKIKVNSTVEENGINGKNDYILVKKKKTNNLNELSDSDDSYEEDYNYNEQILGNKINIFFEQNLGIRIPVIIGSNNTFKDAAIIYCQKEYIPLSLIEETEFLYNGKKLNIKSKKTLETLGIKDMSRILVIKCFNISSG